MAVSEKKSRAGRTTPLENLHAADGRGGALLDQIAFPTQAASGAATLRHAHNFERDLHDHYVEPAWVSARLFAAESFGPPGARVFDPACGWGWVLRAARDAGYTPVGSDLIDRRSDRHAFTEFPFTVCDFLTDSPVRAPWSIVTNPPFDHIEEFTERALAVAVFKVAILMPLRRLPAAHWLQHMLLTSIHLLTPRPSVPTAQYIAAGRKPRGGTQEFVWLIFNKQTYESGAPRTRWLHRDGATP
jgi:hypothetical protein